MKQPRQPLHGAWLGYSSPWSHPPNPKPSAIEAGIWHEAEQATGEIIQRIRPTVESDKRRMAIMEYVQNLIRGAIGVETLPFGSFPLKTYLPDGDIDLTAIFAPNTKDSIISYVRAILEKEVLNTDSEFVVKGVQYIDAEIQIIKCLVQNVMVDISFNQIGGLCSLCFLEVIDRRIGKDHLFKRSIMLVKAWCYYESRILGSHQSLMSTYSIAILVLFIFNFFHSSLDGPLAVLYSFLDYYSKFDWERYCITLRGPVSLSSLPELLVETFDNDGGDLLLTEDFLRNYIDLFSITLRFSEDSSRAFIMKYINIVDPMRENNNLGRSVSQGSFYRILNALASGARKLGQLLSLPAARLRDELNIFFISTLARHGGGESPDVQDLVPRLPHGAFIDSTGPVLKLEKQKADGLRSESLTSKAHRYLNEEMKNITISGLDEREVILAETLLSGNAKDLATSKTSVPRSVMESPKTLSSTKEDDILDFRIPDNAPHLFFNPESQTREELKLDQINSTSLGPSDKEIVISMQLNSGDGQLLLPDECLDLSGDYEWQLNNLKYAVYCLELMSNPHFIPTGHSIPYSDFIRGQDSWTYAGWFRDYQPPFISSSYKIDRARKFRGTGVFFPNVNYDAYEGWYGFENVFPTAKDTFQADTSQGTSSVEEEYHEPAVPTQIVFGNGFKMLPTQLYAPKSSSQHASKAPPNTSGTKPLNYDVVQFGTLPPVLLESPTKDRQRKSDIPLSQTQDSGTESQASSSMIPATNSNTKRKSFQLKDQDFPPLSG